MSKDTGAFFVVSSGRSGTQMFEKLFAGLRDVEIHHEYLCTHIQPVAAMYSMGLIGRDEVLATIRSLHGAAVKYSTKRLWGDSSNKLSWIIPELNEIFPDAKFIHLIRDGRKVVSSFYNKLSDEIYDNRSVDILYRYLDDPDSNPPPPPEKRYWWRVPYLEGEADDRFRAYSQFERIACHWAEVNSVIKRDLATIDPSRTITVKLEELSKDPTVLKGLLSFLEIEYKDDLFSLLKRPHNVNKPLNFMLTDDQKSKFEAIAGPMMRELGYAGTDEYVVSY